MSTASPLGRYEPAAGSPVASPSEDAPVTKGAGKAGEKIDAGKPLVVLEAMKMEHGLHLPFAVKIKTIHVKAGAQVAPGNLLVEFEPA